MSKLENSTNPPPPPIPPPGGPPPLSPEPLPSDSNSFGKA